MAEGQGGPRGFWGRLRGSRIGRWWGALLHDYASAVREAAQDARRRPVAAAAVVAALAGASACARAVPSAESFDAATLEASGTLLLLSPATRSPSADRHVQRLLRRRESGRLRYRNLIFAAVIYEAPHAADAALYSAQCRHLLPRWRDFPGRILDVGFFGRWWVLAARLRDCDINEEEFMALPARLRQIHPNQLRSHRNESRYLEKFQPIILSPEQIRQAESEVAAPGAREHDGMVHAAR
ncbi:mitochondrial import inner membrane translocase subunit Tim29 [Cuculus canorus]|uniref:mitochondrial import inner membrane translocase subunit Tim29 n=1 Tax=Cuculus canorus TaxID=55661 RepID=UPI0023AAF9F1|nr:mitochondrial import inner membrane translocase subunit Tim29 [Cuculus canorus]